MVEKFHSEPLADIYCGNALDVLKELPDESVQMCMTSPAYWGLRNYAGGAELIWGGDPNCGHKWLGELKNDAGFLSLKTERIAFVKFLGKQSTIADTEINNYTSGSLIEVRRETISRKKGKQTISEVGATRTEANPSGFINCPIAIQYTPDKIPFNNSFWNYGEATIKALLWNDTESLETINQRNRPNFPTPNQMICSCPFLSERFAWCNSISNKFRQFLILTNKVDLSIFSDATIRDKQAYQVAEFRCPLFKEGKVYIPLLVGTPLEAIATAYRAKGTGVSSKLPPLSVDNSTAIETIDHLTSSPIWSRQSSPIHSSSICLNCGAVKGQLGLEESPELYVDHLMMIFREVKRVLRKDGSFYLNIGDTYTSGKGSCFNPGGGTHSWQSWNDRKVNYPTGRNAPNRMYKGISPKCMTCIPERVLFAMLGDDWILRNKIAWVKPNNMPKSVKDRYTDRWEFLYFFVKARRYYFNLDAVRVPHKTVSLERYQRGVNLGRPAEGKSGEVGPMTAYTRAPQWFKDMFPPDHEYEGKFDDLFGHGPNPQSFNLRVRDVKRGKKGVSAQGGELKASEEEVQAYAYPEKHHGSPMNNQDRLHRGRTGSTSQYTKRQESIISHFEQKGSGGHYLYGGLESPEGTHNNPKGKNPGDVWMITTKPSSISVCPKCDTVFKRLLKVCPQCGAEGIVGHFAPYPETLCIDPIKASSRVGDTVLDIFAGSGTTGVAAKRLGRKAILIDCVRPYCVMAKYNLQKVEYQPELE